MIFNNKKPFANRCKIEPLNMRTFKMWIRSLNALPVIMTSTMIIFAQSSAACVFGYGAAPKARGEFKGELSGRFVTKPYLNRPLFQLSEPLIYTSPDGTNFTAASNYIVDGASIPRIFWSAIGGPFSANHLKPSVVHDYYTDTCKFVPHAEVGRECQSDLEIFFDDEVVHLNYYLGMLASGVGESDACAEYLAVQTYKTWDLDENLHPVNIEILGRPIGETDVGFVKRSMYLIESAVTATIKTLKSSGGRILNIFPDGEILATPDGLQEYLDRLRSAIDSESYLNDPDSIGLITDERVDSFEKIQPWPENFLKERFDPSTDQFRDLTYFDPALRLQPSPLADELGLSQPPVLIIPIPPKIEGNLYNWDNDQTVLRDQIARSLGWQQGVFPNGNSILLTPTEDPDALEYQIPPNIQDRLLNNGLSGDLGLNGIMHLQDGANGIQELMIQPNPFR